MNILNKYKKQKQKKNPHHSGLHFQCNIYFIGKSWYSHIYNCIQQLDNSWDTKQECTYELQSPKRPGLPTLPSRVGHRHREPSPQRQSEEKQPNELTGALWAPAHLRRAEDRNGGRKRRLWPVPRPFCHLQSPPSPLNTFSQNNVLLFTVRSGCRRFPGIRGFSSGESVWSSSWSLFWFRIQSSKRKEAGTVWRPAAEYSVRAAFHGWSMSNLLSDSHLELQMPVSSQRLNRTEKWSAPNIQVSV